MKWYRGMTGDTSLCCTAVDYGIQYQGGSLILSIRDINSYAGNLWYGYGTYSQYRLHKIVNPPYIYLATPKLQDEHWEDFVFAILEHLYIIGVIKYWLVSVYV